MYNVAVVGCGNIGATIIYDLLNWPAKVAAFDKKDMEIDEGTKGSLIFKKIKTGELEHYDFTNTDAIFIALPSSAVIDELWGLALNNTVVCPIFDVSFFKFFKEGTEEKSAEFIDLDTVLRTRRKQLFMDLGFAPGMSDILLCEAHNRVKQRIYASRRLRAIEDATYNGEINVIGKSAHSAGPVYHSAPWNAEDMLDEYFRPAVIVRDNNILVIQDPLTQCAEDSVITDGLRSLVFTKGPEFCNLVEKTLRDKRHILIIKFLHETGLLYQDIVKTALLKAMQSTTPTDESFLSVRVTGIFNSTNTISEQITLEHKAMNELSSMSMLTGYSCTAAAHYVLSKKTKTNQSLHPGTKYGIVYPGQLHTEEFFKQYTNYLNERDISLNYYSYDTIAGL